MWIRKTTQRAEPPEHSRRRLLRAGTLLALAGATGSLTGCNPFAEQPDPEPDPLAPLLASALDLVARYQAVITANPDLANRLTPIMEAHQAHAQELARVARTPLPSATPTPSGGGDSTLQALRSAEQQGQQAAAELCATVSAERAALAGSIAAARATHLEVLR